MDPQGGHNYGHGFFDDTLGCDIVSESTVPDETRCRCLFHHVGGITSLGESLLFGKHRRFGDRPKTVNAFPSVDNP